MVHVEGWAEEVQEQTTAARAVTDVAIVDDAVMPRDPFLGAAIVAEAAVAPSRLPALLAGRSRWRALLGVGTAWVPFDEPGELEEFRSRAAELGGIAPVVRGPGGLGPVDLPAPEVHLRLKAAFDPGDVLAPGRSWGMPATTAPP